jgi:hypothetical protein
MKNQMSDTWFIRAKRLSIDTADDTDDDAGYDADTTNDDDQFGVPLPNKRPAPVSRV